VRKRVLFLMVFISRITAEDAKIPTFIICSFYNKQGEFMCHGISCGLRAARFEIINLPIDDGYTKYSGVYMALMYDTLRCIHISSIIIA
jgi:hypothetical protein